MSSLFAASIGEQITEVQREIAKRASVYPRLIEAGKLSREKADRHIENMQAVLATLQNVARRAAG